MPQRNQQFLEFKKKSSPKGENSRMGVVTNLFSFCIDDIVGVDPQSLKPGCDMSCFQVQVSLFLEHIY